MPADESLSSAPSARHGDHSQPYWCSVTIMKPCADWSIDYGYCRTSLDVWPESHKQGSSDPRCPRVCPNKASEEVAIEFQRLYKERGNAEAAKFSSQHRSERDESRNS